MISYSLNFSLSSSSTSFYLILWFHRSSLSGASINIFYFLFLLIYFMIFNCFWEFCHHFTLLFMGFFLSLFLSLFLFLLLFLCNCQGSRLPYQGFTSFFVYVLLCLTVSDGFVVTDSFDSKLRIYWLIGWYGGLGHSSFLILC